MAKIQLQFVAGKGLSSKLIAWFGGIGDFSHVDAVFPDGSLFGARSDVVGGKPSGMQLRPPNYEEWARRTIFSLTVPAKLAKNWKAHLLTLEGAPYDSLDILGFIVGDPRLHESGKWVCSAGQTNGLRAVKLLPKKLLVPDHQVEPNDLALMLSAIKFTWEELPTNTLTKEQL